MKFKLRRKIEARDWLHIAGILLMIGLFAWVAVIYTRAMRNIGGGSLLETAQAMKDEILGYNKAAGLTILVALQVLQVVISFIPAAAVQFASGMIYGMGWGMITGIIGTAIGTAVSFYLARLLGRRVITLFLSEKTIAKVEETLAGTTSAFVLLILFILPSPKDVFSYFIGLTHMKAWKYFLISAVGRLPGMFITTYMGLRVLEKANFGVVAVCGILLLAVSFLFAAYQKKIRDLLSRKPKAAAPEAEAAPEE